MRPLILNTLGTITAPPGSIVINHRAGYILKDGLIVPTVPKGPSARIRVFACMLNAQPGIDYDDFFDAVWGECLDPPSGPINYVAALLNNFTIKRPDGIRVRVRDWLGFRVRSYYRKAYYVEWLDPAAVQLPRFPSPREEALAIL